jgi:lipoate-protein ligase B
VYPIFDLEAARIQVDRYVSQMEEVMLRTAEDFGVRATRNPRNRGIWVGNNKMGSIGIALRRGISFHGFALNGTLALTPFSWINPCGLQGVGVTSVAQESAHEVSMAQIRAAVKQHWQDVFEVVLRATSPSELQALLTPSEVPQER